ncbi:hypothetical protein EN817_23420 [Mesorhizobium sp. M3A.F.Ca.ET.174.01.1.1]|uniref:hypothetical protein n=1 Tax=unclassified Mesorhizobium TaxID=325217 RepID=UPI001093D941|nr:MULTISPECIES: hypothetical protein [unclassified Mesorhizobium]TGS85057.1 hypothetical protein EN818_21505 [Mesorhizobium sp. M3A.F.Ca.ET.175.01.1.1]TGT23045.1 hypothetical protein EN817_23420 [Mesorhizobium sp. M3A.F.Ca.ET.174.01.1.1]TIU12868.1 MAG: hypothetical protein E5W44_05655 [Mesorhizobium sp.]
MDLSNKFFAHWAFDIHDLERRGRREVGFIPRPPKCPPEAAVGKGASMHRLMEGTEAVDAEIGLPFAWFFLTTHRHSFDPGVGDAIAEGLRQGRVRCAIETPPCCSPEPTGAICSKDWTDAHLPKAVVDENCACGRARCCAPIRPGAIFWPRSSETGISPHCAGEQIVFIQPSLRRHVRWILDGKMRGVT